MFQAIAFLLFTGQNVALVMDNLPIFYLHSQRCQYCLNWKQQRQLQQQLQQQHASRPQYEQLQQQQHASQLQQQHASRPQFEQLQQLHASQLQDEQLQQQRAFRPQYELLQQQRQQQLLPLQQQQLLYEPVNIQIVS